MRPIMISRRMYVAIVPNRGSPPAILLRESYREAGKTKNRTLANLSRCRSSASSNCAPCCAATNCCPPRRRSRSSARCRMATCSPRSHRAAHRARRPAAPPSATAPPRSGIGPDRRPPARPGGQAGDRTHAGSRHRQPFAGRDAGLGRVTAREVYAALDWLGREQIFIETGLARRHLKNGALLLYDVTSTYLEGRCCELARTATAATTGVTGRNRDRPAVTADGCPSRSKCSGQYRRSDDAVGADRQAEAALSAAARGDGG